MVYLGKEIAIIKWKKKKKKTDSWKYNQYKYKKVQRYSKEPAECPLAQNMYFTQSYTVGYFDLLFVTRFLTLLSDWNPVDFCPQVKPLSILK